MRRFDRIRDVNKIRRVHQEDMCQALGIMNDKKYQADGGPSVGDIYRLLSERSSNPIAGIRSLLCSVMFQFLIGNCDAHGKNFSLLEERDSVVLSPAYDVVSTAILSIAGKKAGNEDRE